MLRTDDSVRRVRAMWLGSGALRWPWDWTYVEWGVAAACAVVAIPLVGLVFAVLLGPLAGLALGVIGGSLVARELFLHLRLAVDYDRPVRWWRVMIDHELRSGRAATSELESMTLVASWVVPVHEARHRARRGRLDVRRSRGPSRRELDEGVLVRLGEVRG
jgi:hypothetical protein